MCTVSLQNTYKYSASTSPKLVGINVGTTFGILRMLCWLGQDSHTDTGTYFAQRDLYAMSKTIQISSPAQFTGLLKSSAVVVVDCKITLLTSAWRGTFKQ